MEWGGILPSLLAYFAKCYTSVWVIQVIPFDLGEQFGAFVRDKKQLMAWIRPAAERLMDYLYIHPRFAHVGGFVLRQHQALNDYLDEALQE